MLDNIVSCCPQAKIIDKGNEIVIIGCGITVIIHNISLLEKKKQEFCDKVAKERAKTHIKVS